MKLFLVTLFFLTISHECIAYPKQRKQQNYSSNGVMQQPRANRRVKSTIYTVKVDGVECALCAQSVVDIFTNIEGFERVVYIQLSDEDYKFNCTWMKKGENIPLLLIKKLIKKEGFELTSIQGDFFGELQDTPKPHINLADEHLELSLPEMPAKTFRKKRMVSGLLVYNAKKDTFNFAQSSLK